MLLFSVLIALIGLALTAGGIQLLSLGGSLYYLAAGLVLLLNAWLGFKRHALTRPLFALFLVVTMIWSLWESGYDWWALAPRLGLFMLLAIPLLVSKVADKGGRKVLFPVWAVLGVMTLGSLLANPHDLSGKLDMQVVRESPNLGYSPESSWYAYGRTNMGQRYSPLDQITPQNVGKLEEAWRYRTGDMKRPEDVTETTYQATPLKIGDTLYLCTPHNWLVALDADQGTKRWVYDAKVPAQSQRQHQTCRGVSYLPPDSGETPSAEQLNIAAETQPPVECDAALFMPTSDARLLAFDPATGALCARFGNNGELDLTHNMPYKQAGFYYSTSPPVVANGLIIVAGSVNDNYDKNSPSGVIRAYDAKTAALVWNWDSGNPYDTTPIAPDEVYMASSPNSWAVASADEELGLIYFPMGNRTPDQLGWYRSEHDETYASSVVALSLDTGQVVWVQQFVHHDLWDMDTPAQPSLIDLDTENGPQPALVIPTKQGDVYVLNRETGEPIFPITELPAPQGTVELDHAAPTQPISALTFRPPAMTEKEMWGATPLDQMWCRIQFKSLRYEGQYTPPSEQGTLVYPGNFGVFNWGGIAVDPKRQLMFGMPVYLAFIQQLVKKDGSDMGATNQGEQGLNSNEGAPYAVDMRPFLSPLDIPCQQPPWGYVAGVDLKTGEIVYKHTNGTIQDLSPLPLPLKMGVPGIGGPVITEGGVAFLAATVDDYLRAYDVSTGEQLWQARLPAGGQATPMTYLNSLGEQMVVQVAGGHGSVGTSIGDYVIAYKLKR
ncbi:membrane-bound PQQ-dependent dehydrogenase, glucose/quinate/shikimate family [Nitrincola tibetensis]|uniref:Membrane-bound PQQ-dependent dehydrogenase, glucose/quinate/shikimate family n=1 Tax=Nitrincola tibetensis TaxID=2219697 RepID=A0A364NP22_9GAMM|nr:glucose/quinate/shikimate family membrane-bound PQQ-dependent dehydrogenase [Nitrincola tibetensis]RAU18772.1 membrane-bound PQQ-dependent dehydrogenase, glucose/quinate/shikimate family [Nitrincola tibetensis]